MALIMFGPVIAAKILAGTGVIAGIGSLIRLVGQR